MQDEPAIRVFPPQPQVLPRTNPPPPISRRPPRRRFPGQVKGSRASFDHHLGKLVKAVRRKRAMARANGSDNPTDPLPNVYAVATSILVSRLVITGNRRRP